MPRAWISRSKWGSGEYELVQSTVPTEGTFSLNNMTGELTFVGTITTTSTSGILQILARDLGTDPVTSPVTIQVILTVRSASSPFFDPDGFQCHNLGEYSFSICQRL